ncbi:venom metalloproteinase 3-like [Leptopilina heterotoma]|uniref:venom metalloproteinase 3-like n=1 Tax=Leptopilina heterotoma TaxID=63436 RepID=UPI001CA93BC3|nr:venom metalloproteinase 3-like [Leptopilina heterotoma]
MYRDVEAIKKYIATYWSAVDLRYRQLSNPAVRLNIAAVILSTGRQEVPFIQSSIYDRIKIDADKVLIETGKYLLSNKIFRFRDNFDLSLTMTSRNMCTIDTNGDDCSTMGYAYVSSACSVIKSEDNSYKMVEGVGMVEDNGGFKGIMLAAHELGHILGVEHDEVGNCKYRYGIEDGYIMENQLAFSDNSFDWSPCSLRNFSIFLNHGNATCLRNKPIIGNKINNFLPGQLYSLEHQCEKHYPGSRPCKEGTFLRNICLELNCILPFTNECVRTVPAAEGSPCGLNSGQGKEKCGKSKRPATRFTIASRLYVFLTAAVRFPDVYGRTPTPKRRLTGAVGQ